MKKALILFSFVAMVQTGWSQEAEIKTFITHFFQSMYKRDTAELRKMFVPAASLYTYSFDSKGNPRSKGETVSDFLRGVSLIGEAQMEERLTSWQFLMDGGMVSVWTPYEFYFEGKFTHCGTDSWQIMQVLGEWKITQLSDTRRKTNCPDDELTRFVIDSLVNEWHHAASIADEDAFFGFMTKEAVYIGTDATERWLRDELREWSKKYFDRESAWSFTPISRTINFGPGKNIAWFDELLETGMGVCRSTGIVELIEGQWKLVHYQLSVTLPNEKLDAFLKLTGKS